MQDKSSFEKFPANDLVSLRAELTQSGIDSWQAAQAVAVFLAGRGYGVDSKLVPDAIIRLEGKGCTFECMQQELERVALVM
jgi:hypothetical protein